MKERRLCAIAIALMLAGALAPPIAAAQDLSAEGQRIVNEIVEQWTGKFRSTGIALAMRSLGMEPDDDLRLEVGEHLRANTGLARPLRTWGANNYILSNDEKVIAKFLISAYEENDQLPTLEEIAEAVGIAREELAARLEFMADAGFLTRPEDGGAGFSLVEGYKAWGGPLRYNFHTVTVEGEKSFGVW